MQRVRRILKRIKREPVLLAAVVSVATAVGLDDVAAQVGVDVTQQTVAGVIGVILVATRAWTASRQHTRDVESERDTLKREMRADGAPGKPA